MKPKHVIALSLISALSAAGLTQAFAEPAPSERGFFRHHGGWGHGRDAASPDRLCGEDVTGQIDLLIGIVPAWLRLSDAQGTAWQDLASALRTAATTYSEACTGIAAPADGASAVEHMARAETLLEAGLAAIAHLRPSFTAFYRTLDAGQKATVDGWLSHRRHG